MPEVLWGMLGTAAWEREFDRWLASFWDALGDARQRRWGPVYVRGLLGAGDRKSVEPMAARVAPDEYGQLQPLRMRLVLEPARSAPSRRPRTVTPGDPPRAPRAPRRRPSPLPHMQRAADVSAARAAIDVAG